jgi:hypothetical protein
MKLLRDIQPPEIILWLLTSHPDQTDYTETAWFEPLHLGRIGTTRGM